MNNCPLKLGLIIFSCWLLLIGFSRSVYAADPHLEFSPSSGSISSEGSDIGILIDTGGQAVKSAKAVVQFDASLLECTSVQAGDFFDDVSHNIYNSEGEVVINANLSLDSMLESKTGSGTLASLSLKAKAASGSASLDFSCTEGSSTDSNINDPTPSDIIVCSSNVNGSYSLGETQSTSSASTADSTATSTDGSTSEADESPPPIPVTGVSFPTIVLLFSGFLLLFFPAFL